MDIPVASLVREVDDTTNWPFEGGDILYWRLAASLTQIMFTPWLVVPNSYDGSPMTLKLYYSMTSATSGDVKFIAQMMAVTPGDSQDVDVDSYGTAGEVVVTVPGTAYNLDVASIDMDEDGAAAGDLFKIKFWRAGPAVEDTASNWANLHAMKLVW